ncbi:hypothetical protein GCM10010896_03840 [Mammaliicoccus stepanovicii]|nr:hypothetical protein GCM10010896_03840 [Mammaliicoccus stepanovicii]
MNKIHIVHARTCHLELNMISSGAIQSLIISSFYIKLHLMYYNSNEYQGDHDGRDDQNFLSE